METEPLGAGLCGGGACLALEPRLHLVGRQPL